MRPILMTSASMVLGMLPTAFSGGAGSEFRSPMAMGVIGGVISSTVLTLLVVPVFYLFMEWVRRAPGRMWRWARGDAPLPAPGAPAPQQAPGESPAE